MKMEGERIEAASSDDMLSEKKDQKGGGGVVSDSDFLTVRGGGGGGGEDGEEEETEEENGNGVAFVPGPLIPLKQELEKDKVLDDESLRRWKEKLLGCTEGNLNVGRSKGMLGTFAPQREPYTHILEEETTPSDLLARGVYLAKLKFVDDDRRRHLELDYSFEIKRH